jgi:adenylosuccinate synthase
VKITPESLRIAENVCLILSLHQELDALRESSNSVSRIGTTRRGIGPAYEDKVGRRAIRLMDLADIPALKPKIERLLAHHNALRRGLGIEEVDPQRLYAELANIAPRVLPYMDRVWSLLDDKRREGKRILFEGAQAVLLDIDHGTYPFVTSSSTTSGGASTGTGIPPTDIDAVLGVVKAYTTRVGAGPLPTEMEEPLAADVRKLGNEFGATTGRPRRCGWFDAVVVRYASRINGLTDLAVTKLDVLDTLDRLAICVGYEYEGELHEEFPADLTAQERVVPRYEWLEGWRVSTAKARRIDELPAEARRYLDRMQELVETPIRYVSVGTRREQIIESSRE